MVQISEETLASGIYIEMLNNPVGKHVRNGMQSHFEFERQNAPK
ncbi:hypothetical protein [Novosphingobium flavum]|nr:hypothetical protein [Novosphingobium flavum]